MNLIEANTDTIIALCKTHFIKELYSFGSINTENFNADSDIDFLYKIDIDKFNNWDLGRYDYTDNLLSFENALSSLLKRKVDLMPSETIGNNKYMKQAIEVSKKIVYVA